MSEKTDTLEAAIPKHLRVKRIVAARTPEGFVPTTNSYSARFNPSIKTLPMCYFGVQFKKISPQANELMSRIKRAYGTEHGPKFWDEARYLDEEGFTNVLFAGYWKSHETFNTWREARPDTWWYDGVQLGTDVGVFKEVYTPDLKDTETTFSHKAREGYTHLADKMSEPTDSHEYWGSARDRIPRSQTDELVSIGKPTLEVLHRSDDKQRLHVIVKPHQNLALLRSGQDWSSTNGAERDFYLGRVQPILKQGMDFIVQHGPSIGCFYNRYMHLSVNGTPSEKSYSLSAWNSLSDLENWAENHETHLAIFHIGIKHYKNAGDAAALKLYHEMFVLKQEDQYYEYFNCHTKTGMLNGLCKPLV